jgi:hypothetical protein
MLRYSQNFVFHSFPCSTKMGVPEKYMSISGRIVSHPATLILPGAGAAILLLT